MTTTPDKTKTPRQVWDKRHRQRKKAKLEALQERIAEEERRNEKEREKAKFRMRKRRAKMKLNTHATPLHPQP